MENRVSVLLVILLQAFRDQFYAALLIRHPLGMCKRKVKEAAQRWRDLKIETARNSKLRNRMPFGGLTDPKDVDDIVAYLKVLK